MTRVVVLGDVGADQQYHAGDEAMAEAAVDELGSRLDLDVVAISGHPSSTTATYGWAAAPRFDFVTTTPTEELRRARYRAIVDAADGSSQALPWGDPAWEVIKEVAAADAVLISGGGNLSSTWPEHVYERAALAKVAARFSKPLVVSGQTLGPHLTAGHGQLVAEILTSAVLVGVRERPSYDVALRLGVSADRLTLTVDDAAYLDDTSADWTSPAREYVAATFAPHSGLLSPDACVRALGRLVLHTADATGLDVVLVPHQGSTAPGARTVDVAFHDAVRDATGAGDRVHSLPMMSGRATAAAARRAQLVVSSRYHPAVFALSAGVPTVTVCVDAYTSTKIGGAMENYGLGAYAVSVPSLVNGEADTVVTEAWKQAATLRSALLATSASRRSTSATWWDAVAGALQGSTVTAPPSISPVEQIWAGDWSRSASSLRTWADELSARVSGDQIAEQEVLATLEQLQRRVAELELERAAHLSELDEAALETDSLRAAVNAAQRLAGARLEQIATMLESQPTIDALRAELAAMRNTRTFRYLQAPRDVYGRMRRG